MMRINSITNVTQRLLIAVFLLAFINGCQTTIKLEDSPYGLLIHTSLTGDMSGSGERANQATIQGTFCELYLFLSPLGNEVAVDARLAKSKNYNGANDLRYLGYTYEMKFQRDTSRYVKKTRKIPCDGEYQWLVEDVPPGVGYRLYVSWTGFWNGFKELDHDVVTEDMIKEILVGDAKEKYVVLSALVDVD